jgi:hypothetical protein
MSKVEIIKADKPEELQIKVNEFMGDTRNRVHNIVFSALPKEYLCFITYNEGEIR